MKVGSGSGVEGAAFNLGKLLSLQKLNPSHIVNEVRSTDLRVCNGANNQLDVLEGHGESRGLENQSALSAPWQIS